MRVIRWSLASIAAGAAISAGVPCMAHAQSTGAPAGACVSATGPDTGAAPRDSARGTTGPRAASDTAHPAIRLFAAVQAQEVRFERQPKICVSLRGDAQLDSVRVLARRNLASPVVQGTTYRDVYVAVEILGHLDAQCLSARITGGTPPAGVPCASLGVRDSAAARRTGAPPP